VTALEGCGVEELRRTALEALGAHGDQRAIDALRSAVLAITPGAARWHSSSGPVQAHRVTLGLEAGCLGRLRAAPATVDALGAALAAAIARWPGETLLELVLRWAPGTSPLAAGYRNAPPQPVSIREALVEYLDAAGERSLARAIAGACVAPEYPSSGDQPERVPPRVVLGLDPAERAALESLQTDRRALATITRAVRDLLGDARARLEVT
jgi:hypothetical protein